MTDHHAYQLAAVHDGQADWDDATPVSMPRLTPQQRRVYAHLRAYIDVHGYPPTLGQLAEQLGLASRSTVAYHVTNLETKGLVQRDGHVIRGVRVVRNPWGYARQELYAVTGVAA